MNHSNNFCHPALDDEQQQQAAAASCSNSSIATHTAAVALCMHKYMPGKHNYVVQQCNYKIISGSYERYWVVKPHTVRCLIKKI